MDQKVEIREEPVWPEGTARSSLESFELVSEVIPLKQEIKSELTELGPTQKITFKENFELVSEMTHLKQETKSELTEAVPTLENAVEPAADIKGDKIIEEHTIGQLDPHLKEKNRVENVDTREVAYHRTVCSLTFSHKYTLKEHMLSHSKEYPFHGEVCK